MARRNGREQPLSCSRQWRPLRQPERTADLAFAMAKSEVGDSKRPADIRKLAEASSDLKEARGHVHDILDAKWPKAANALSGRLKLVGPQLKDAEIWVKWPTHKGDGKVLEITHLFVPDTPTESRRKRSSQPTRRHANVINDIAEGCVFSGAIRS